VKAQVVARVANVALAVAVAAVVDEVVADGVGLAVYAAYKLPFSLTRANKVTRLLERPARL
jgi:hypothetical protein